MSDKLGGLCMSATIYKIVRATTEILLLSRCLPDVNFAALF